MTLRLAAATFGTQQANTADRASVLLVTGLALAYAVIAVANVMAIASAGRRSEFLALRLAGATRSQVLCLAASESAVCAAIGTLAAAAAGLTVIAVQRIVLTGAAGGFPPYLPLLPAGVVAAAGTVIGVLAAVTTAAWEMRNDRGWGRDRGGGVTPGNVSMASGVSCVKGTRLRRKIAWALGAHAHITGSQQCQL